MVLTLCNLCWWCSSLHHLAKYSTCTHGGHHLLQPALVVFFLGALAHLLLCTNEQAHISTCTDPQQFALVVFFIPATSANTAFVVLPSVTCAGGLFPRTTCAYSNLHCVVVVVVVVVVVYTYVVVVGACGNASEGFLAPAHQKPVANCNACIQF